MKKDEIKIGHAYEAKVSDRIVTVRIDSTNSHGGWNATNTATGKRIHVKSAQRLRRAVPAGKKAEDAAQPEVNPTVEIVTGQPVPAPEKKTRAKKAPAEPKPKRVSALDAAAEVLKADAKPMRAKELIEAMAKRNLWQSPNGKTPEATLYAAILREIGAKGADARFRKVERGQFEYADK